LPVTWLPQYDVAPETSITSAAGTATVYFTNTIPGTAYSLEYCTNLTTGNWQPVGTQPAPDDSASQTDSEAGGEQRYYRVFYRPYLSHEYSLGGGRSGAVTEE